MMTAKERQQMQRLEIENQALALIDLRAHRELAILALRGGD